MTLARRTSPRTFLPRTFVARPARDARRAAALLVALAAFATLAPAASAAWLQESPPPAAENPAPSEPAPPAATETPTAPAPAGENPAPAPNAPPGETAPAAPPAAENANPPAGGTAPPAENPPPGATPPGDAPPPTAESETPADAPPDETPTPSEMGDSPSPEETAGRVPAGRSKSTEAAAAAAKRRPDRPRDRPAVPAAPPPTDVWGLVLSGIGIVIALSLVVGAVIACRLNPGWFAFGAVGGALASGSLWAIFGTLAAYIANARVGGDGHSMAQAWPVFTAILWRLTIAGALFGGIAASFMLGDLPWDKPDEEEKKPGEKGKRKKKKRTFV